MAEITRKGFLGAVAAAIGAPAVAGAKVARRRDVITQKELHAIVDRHEAVWDSMWDLRRRIDAGAAVQHGDLVLEAGTVGPHKRDESLYGYGQIDCEIDISRAEDVKRRCARCPDLSESTIRGVVGGAAALGVSA